MRASPGAVLKSAEQDPKYLHDKEFFLKKFCTSDAKTYYENDIAALEMLKRTEGAASAFVNYYGSFRLNGTYNVLLEYAGGGTLDDYYQFMDPPTAVSEAIDFWLEMLKLSKAIKIAHDIKDTFFQRRSQWPDFQG